MYEQLLVAVVERMQLYGECLQPICSDECLQDLQLRARLQLGRDVPDEYCRFLMKANGLDWNGLVVYASERAPIVGYPDRFIEGFVEANLGYRDHEALKDYLIFADDGVVFFTYHISQGTYDVILRVGLSLLETFSSFDKLLMNALSGVLGSRNKGAASIDSPRNCRKSSCLRIMRHRGDHRK